MYQGNFALIKNSKTDETRWVWKLHVKGSKKLFFDTADPSFSLEQTDVDEGGHASVDRPWYVVYEVPADQAHEYVKFTPPDIKSVEIESAYQLKQSIIELEAAADFYKEQVLTARSKFDQAEAEYAEVRKKLDTLRYQFNNTVSKSVDPVFCYVYGIHNLNNRTEYCWYADGKVAANVKAGDIVSVETVQGDALAFVTRVERSNEYVPHKRVLKIKHAKENTPDLPF